MDSLTSLESGEVRGYIPYNKSVPDVPSYSHYCSLSSFLSSFLKNPG